MQSGETAISSADAQEILKLKVKLPMENKSLDNLRRLDVVCTVLLPEGHAYRNYVKAAPQGHGGLWLELGGPRAADAPSQAQVGPPLPLRVPPRG